MGSWSIAGGECQKRMRKRYGGGGAWTQEKVCVRNGKRGGYDDIGDHTHAPPTDTLSTGRRDLHARARACVLSGKNPRQGILFLSLSLSHSLSVPPLSVHLSISPGTVRISFRLSLRWCLFYERALPTSVCRLVFPGAIM